MKQNEVKTSNCESQALDEGKKEKKVVSRSDRQQIPEFLRSTASPLFLLILEWV